MIIKIIMKFILKIIGFLLVILGQGFNITHNNFRLFNESYYWIFISYGNHT